MWKKRKELGGWEERGRGQDPSEVPDARRDRRPGLRKGKESLNLNYPPNHRERVSLDRKLHPYSPNQTL